MAVLYIPMLHTAPGVPSQNRTPSASPPSLAQWFIAPGWWSAVAGLNAGRYHTVIGSVYCWLAPRRYCVSMMCLVRAFGCPSHIVVGWFCATERRRWHYCYHYGDGMNEWMTAASCRRLARRADGCWAPVAAASALLASITRSVTLARTPTRPPQTVIVLRRLLSVNHVRVLGSQDEDLLPTNRLRQGWSDYSEGLRGHGRTLRQTRETRRRQRKRVEI